MIHPVILFFQSVQFSATLQLSWKILFLHTHLELFLFFFLPSLLLSILPSLWHRITSSPAISPKPSCLLLTYPFLSPSPWHSNNCLHLHCFQIPASFSYVYSFFTYYLCLSECIQPSVPFFLPPLNYCRILCLHCILQ